MLVIAATISKQEQFFDAIKTRSREERDLGAIKQLLQDPEVDPRANKNEAFMCAVRNDDLLVVKLLLDDGRVDPQDGNSFALRTAVFSSKHSMVRLLLDSPLVNPACSKNEALTTAIRRGDLAMMEILLDDRRTLRYTYEVKDVLFFALDNFNGNTGPFKTLMYHGKIDKDAVNTLFLLAISRDKQALVKWFLTQPIIEPEFLNQYPIAVATKFSRYEIAKWLLADRRVDAGATNNFPLHLAIARRDHRMVEMLLGNANVNPDIGSRDLLTSAILQGDYFIADSILKATRNPSLNDNLALRVALMKKDLEFIRMILAHPNIDLSRPMAYPLILYAVDSGKLEIVKTIVAYQDFPSVTTKQHINRALKLAQGNGYVGIVDFLRQVNVNTLSGQDVADSPSASPGYLKLRSVFVDEMEIDLKQNHDVPLHAPLTSQLSKVDELLNNLFSGGPSFKFGFELLRSIFLEYAVCHKQMALKEMRQSLKTFMAEPFTCANEQQNHPSGMGPIVQENDDIFEESNCVSESEGEPSPFKKRMTSDDIFMEHLAESENEAMEVEEN
jgi:ankyrin repeat protein